MELPQMRSPDSTAALASESSKMRLLGRFRPDTHYRAHFHCLEPSGVLLTATSDVCALECGAVCDSAGVNALVCDTPLWAHGFRATILSILHAPDNASVLRPLWQKVCLSAACGFSPAPRAQPAWYTLRADRNSRSSSAVFLLHPALRGGVVHVR